jgi:perosamine synthetase
MLKFQNEIEFIKNLFGNKDFIPLHEPLFIGNEKKYVLDTIDSTFVSSVGKYVDLFEDKIKEYTGAKHAIAVVNGTAALHMSLILAGVKQKNLVITQPLTFIATCNAISYLGAEPAFVDIDVNRLGMSPESLKTFLQDVELVNEEPRHKKTGQKVAACIPMHTFGFPVEIDKIIEICNEYNIPVIEDAAESLGSTYKGKHTGTFGLLGTYSFNGNKTITCGGGGIIVTNDDELGKLAKHLTTQAKVPHRWEYVHDNFGYNYRCPNLNAALACAQIEQLDIFLADKRDTARKYETFFDLIEEVKFITEPFESKANYWLNTILMKDEEDRNLFLQETNDNGVMTRPTWALMNHLKMFEKCLKVDLTNSISVEKRLVNIPSSVKQK